MKSLKSKINDLKTIPIKYYYLAFFVCNFLISFALLRGWFNPNISPISNFGSIRMPAFLVIVSLLKSPRLRRAGG